MAKTHKIQVTLESEHYERVAERAKREGKKLAAVVRESVIRYCVDPEDKRRRLDAIRALEAVNVPVGDYVDWKREYADAKGGPQHPGSDNEPTDA